jgi:signal transduction histidine kinase
MRIKLVPVLLALIMIVITVACFGIYNNIKNNMIDSIEIRISKISADMVIDIAKDPDAFQKRPQKFLYPDYDNVFSASDILIQLMDADGNILAKSQNLKRKDLYFIKGKDDVLRDVELKNGARLKICQREITIEEKTIGYVIVGLPTSNVYNSLAYLRNSLIVLMLGLFVIMGTSVSFIARTEIIENQKRFLSFTSHELRTPLSVISGHAEVALRNDMDNAQYKETLKLIRDESVWMNRLVSNLLSFFRSESGSEKIHKKAMHLSEIIVSEASSIKSRYPKKKITLKLNSDDSVMADPEQMKKVISNLLENAAKYTADDGSILVSLENEKNVLVLKVKDNGVGIKSDDQKKIFEPYFRIEGTASRGTGLGLAITKWVVQAHGGTINVHSRSGEGSTFTVTLPRS